MAVLSHPSNLVGGADEQMRDPSPPPPIAVERTVSQEAPHSSTSNQLSILKDDEIHYAVGPTLLPTRIAELVTDVSVVARVSLRAAAFFLEVCLEAARLSTSFGIGLTRKALITAIGAARTMHALTPGPNWPNENNVGTSARLDPFLAILDRYTAVGIYVIHHNLSMAELFAMSGINLVQGTIRAGATVADESVRVIDGIFGSNESSRALSAFISLVRREFSEEKCSASGGGIRTLASLTRSVTTFAVVQAATYKRTAREFKMKALYDYTVLGEAETASWKALLLGPSKFQGTQPARANRSPVELKNTKPRLSGPPRLEHGNTVALRSPIASPTGTKASNLGRGSVNINVPSSSKHRVGDTNEEKLSGCDFHIGSRELTVTQPKAIRDLVPQLHGHNLRFEDAELEKGVVLDHTDGSTEKLARKSFVRKVPGTASPILYEVVTETTEVIETIDEELIDYAGSSPPRGSRIDRDDDNARSQPLSPSMVAADDFNSHTIVKDESRWPDTWRKHAIPGGRRKQTENMLKRDVTNLTDTDMAGRSNRNLLSKSTASLTREKDGGLPTQPRKKMSSVLKRVRKSFVRTKTTTTFSAAADIDMGKEVVRMSSHPGHLTISATPPEAPARTSSRPPPPFRLQQSRDDTIGPVTPSDDFYSTATEFFTSHDRIADLAHSGPPFRSRRSSNSSKPPPTPDFSRTQSGRHSRALSHTSLRSLTSRRTYHSTSKTDGDNIHEKMLFPPKTLPDNLQHFMRYASASYGSHFLNIFGLGETFSFKNNKQAHANEWAFANHVGIGVEDILLSSYTDDASVSLRSEKMTPIVNFVAIDREYKSVVLACRGTLGLSDLLVDLTAEYQDVKLECGDGFVHRGMYAAARRLSNAKGTVASVLRKALEANPSFGLVVVGHSLGAGVAVLVAALWSCRLSDVSDCSGGGQAFPSATISDQPFVTSLASGLPPGRPIHAFAYGSPPISDADLAKKMSGLVTTVVHNFDCVPTLSLGTVQDLRDISELLETSSGSSTEVLGRTVGLYRQRSKTDDTTDKGIIAGVAVGLPADGLLSTDVAAEERLQAIDSKELVTGKSHNIALDEKYIDPKDRDDRESNHEDWLWSLIKTMRAHAQSEKLYPSGRVYCVESFEVYVKTKEYLQGEQGQGEQSKTTSAQRVILRLCEDVVGRFSEPIFCRSLFRDHLPTNYEFCLDLLKQAREQPNVTDDN